MAEAVTEASLVLPPVKREECAYARCYCEENVFHLCKRLSEAAAAAAAEGGGSLAAAPRVSALFISNARKCVPIWGQRRSESEQAAAKAEGGRNEPMLWDYHVVCLVEPPSPPPTSGPGAAIDTGSALIYDLDTTLEPFPCPAPRYVEEAFHPHVSIRGDFRQRFRLVPFSLLQQRFASDRSHMRRADGGWNAPPPSWAPIRGPDAGSPMTLPRFWDVAAVEGGEEDGELGTVLSLPALMRRLRMDAVGDGEEEEEEEDGYGDGDGSESDSDKG